MTTFNEAKFLQRRAFLKSAARAALLGGCGVIAWKVLPRGGECQRSILCERCQLFQGCDLDKAAQARQQRTLGGPS
jgi:hypothetical protein